MQGPLKREGTLVAVDGDLPVASFIEELRRRHRALIAADGAAIKLLDQGIFPDVVIGDFDGISRRRMELFTQGTLMIEMNDQDQGDFEKALRWCIERGETDITVIGVAGGMVDHTLNNFSVLAKFAPLVRLQLCDESSSASVVTEGIRLRTLPGDRISLIPLPLARLTTSGLAWELQDETLEFGLREGASNTASLPEVVVTVHEGVVIVFHYPRRD